ncbi:MAG: aminotransferase class III-fold pyridoxal phosphate-dependent enzyme, partial [Acidimicrobiales bacterium]
VLHLRHAFHGRSGYTMSLTNTDPKKVDRFPKFDWPRIASPAVIFPLEENLAAVEASEEAAILEAEAAFEGSPDDICCFIFEPIQAEGGDRHLRAEFLQAMQALCRRHDALFIADEVQTGAGVTGTPWCYQQLGLEPDVVSFGKKVQLGGIMGGRRVDEVKENVFKVPGRINSTWGGNLVDMARSTRLLELVEATRAMDNASVRGAELLAGLQAVSSAHLFVTNPRGRGLLAAIDVPSARVRDEVLGRLRSEERLLALACGERSIRFRPALSVTSEEVASCLEALEAVLARTEVAP